MTIGRAIALLLLSGLITAVGVIMVVARINSGIVDGTIDSRATGAGLGDNPATPIGSNNLSRGGAAATITAVVREATALGVTAEAALTPVPSTPGTGVGSLVAVGEQIDLDGSRYTVIQVLDPEPAGFFKPIADNRRVAIELRQEAISERKNFNFTQFKISDSEGAEYSWAISNSEPKFGTGALQPGEANQGWLSFQLPVGKTLDVFVVQNFGRPSVPIVNLR
jgi:hypothetical protein